jgi:hypothetical protein
LHESFLAFSHRLWFGVVSNQLQPREMYAQWRREMETPAFYEELQDQLGEAAEFLETLEQTANADAATRLSVVATMAAVLGLPTAMLSIVDKGPLFHKFSDACWRADFGSYFLLVGLTAGLVMLLGRLLQLHVAPQGKQKTFTVLRWLLASVFLIGTFAAGGLRVYRGALTDNACTMSPPKEEAKGAASNATEPTPQVTITVPPAIAPATTGQQLITPKVP